MTRTRFVALVGLTCALAMSGRAQAQTTGGIVGTVVEQQSGQPLAGVTVLVQGPQGDQGSVTGEDGGYEVAALPLGTYVVHFYYGDVAVEQRQVLVSVDKTVRVNARMPAAAVQTVQIVEKAPVVDVGSSRVGVTFDQELIRNVPFTFDLGGMLEKAPGAFSDPTPFFTPPSAGLSFAGTTGAENAYVLDGVNMTSIGFGTLGFDLASPFIDEVEIVTGGYGAEYGRAMGGVVNVATKSGSNEWKGSALTYLTPAFLAAKPRRVYNWSTALTAREEPRYLADLGLEVGGPLVKNKLFFWAGYAPELGRSRTVRITSRFVDADNDGQPDGAGGVPILEEIGRQSFGDRITTHQYAAKLSYRPAPEHTLSLGFYGLDGRNQFLREANADPRASMTLDRTRRQDVSARWISKLLERRLQLEGNLGLHSEGNISDSPYADERALNQVVWYNAPSLASFEPALGCPDNAMTGFKSCPVQQYKSGGYGIAFDRQALRTSGQLKGSLLFRALGWHQLKAGGDYQIDQYDSARYYSGPPGGRARVLVNDGFVPVLSLYRLLPGERLSQFQSDDMTGDPDPDRDGRTKADLLMPPRYQDTIRAKTKTFGTSAFLQDSWSLLANLTLNLGMRWEAQQIQDFQGGTPITINNAWAPRLGLVYDPTNEGRSKVYGHFGTYFESIPMDLNDRAFGGEGVLASIYTDPMSCTVPVERWGSGNPAMGWKSCAVPPAPAQVTVAGENLVVQRKLKGSSSSEVVLGAQYQIISDLTVGAAYIKRWINRIIEDAAGIVANPGDIPGSVLDRYEAEARAAEQAAAMPGASAAVQAQAREARTIADAARTAASFPRPRRDYDALQLTATKRLSQRWTVAASYTYSRTRGNYPGLYAADTGQLDPNYTSLYDLAELLMNRDGPLPNDRPHILRADGYYQQPLGKRSAVTLGLGALARSGRPNNTLGAHPVYGQSESFILPRGSAGRTPAVTRFDLHLGYRHKLSDGTHLDAFIDVFNVFNQRTALLQDQDYTLDPVEPVIGGDARDLPHLKNVLGAPVTKNPNYRAATAYQAPISGRLGLRLSF
jgi:TonB-dependent receptor-like protein/carboxypeptidase family protein